MIDREAESLRYKYRHNRAGWICGTILVLAALAAGIYFGWFYTGWVGIPRTQYLYFVDRGIFLENTWIKSDDGTYYYTDRNAKMARGIYEIDGHYYLFSQEDGSRQTGWADAEDGRMHFGEGGRADIGWAQIDGKNYYFSKEGVLESGWITVDGKTYYLSADGERTDGWKEIDGKKYYFGRDGVMRTGWAEADGNRYLFSEDGEMRVGDQTVDGKLYHLKEDGSMLTGWYETDGGKRYHDDTGAAKKGWAEIDGETYFFDDSYLMRTGEVEVDGHAFYLEEDGTVAPGWHESEDGDFYVCRDGFVLDTEAETGTFGRLVIRDCDIDVAVYTASERVDYQDIVDREDSALAVRERRDVEYAIADRRSQGFVLDNAKEGSPAYLIRQNGDIEEYVCTRALIGTNSDDDVTDEEGVSIWRQNEGGFVTYASAGQEDKEKVWIAFWDPYPEEDSEEDS